jgi:hypothetical protein
MYWLEHEINGQQNQILHTCERSNPSRTCIQKSARSIKHDRMFGGRTKGDSGKPQQQSLVNLVQF